MTDKEYIYKAVESLNKNRKCNLIIKDIKEVDTYYEVFIVDKDIKEKMDKARPHFHFIDYVPEFKALVTKQFIIANKLPSFDGLVGIPQSINKATRIVLRVAWWILGELEHWKAELLSRHEELK